MSQELPKITESTKFNFITSIWIVPFIALVIAGWLGYKHFAERGAEIEIVFHQNEGLIAGQSVVKFRNVPVGKVTKIYVEEGTAGVIVVVRLNSKSSKPYLTENARFWIVKPEVGLNGVSGLDTLISGTYINVYSQIGGKEPKKKFIGLTQPYRDSMKGEYFHLKSINGDNVSVGTPVYFKSIRVGQVEYLNLGLDNKSVDVIVFIDKLYVSYVHEDSKFWSQNMVNIDFSKGNFDINIAPMNLILQGGIVFSSSGEDKSKTVSYRHVFHLYKSKTEAESKTIGSKIKGYKTFMLITNKSTANLRLNAPVRFEGFDVGSVKDIKLSYDKVTHKMHSKVLVGINTSVFLDANEVNSNGELNFYQAIEEGMRAKITSFDPLTGMLFIDLTFNHNEGNASVIRGGQYVQLPMVNEAPKSVMTGVVSLLDKLNKLPLEKLLVSLNNVVDKSAKPMENLNTLIVDLQTTVKNINKLTNQKSFKTLPKELNKVLGLMRKTLKTSEKVVKGYDSNSLVKHQLTQTLKVLTKTSEEMQVFLRMLNRKPNSLIFGDK
ncbi:MAG: MlaD family protein [Campylobacterota bacterium]|nr:MlaD family protein [Campylobacterota bacterium]